MINVEWSDGLSTGDEAIDDDHKKLLTLINQILTAIESQQTHQAIRKVFDELEDYIKQHFAREEQLMLRCQYDGFTSHIQEHRAFTKKIPQLKSRLLTNSSRQVAEEVSQYLINWTINHIVAEDQLYVSAINEHCLPINTEQNKQSLLNRYARWLSHHLALNRRIFLTALLPMVYILFFGFIIICSSVRQLTELKTLEELFYLVNYTGELVHNLQAERGLSTGMISSNYQAFNKDLTEQRQLSDKAINELKLQLASLPHELSSGELNSHIELIKARINRLSEQRLRIDSKSISITEMKDYYTDVIIHLLSLPDGIAQHQMDSELTNRILAFNTIMHLKEAVGLERALGTKAIEQGELIGENLRSFALLIGEQQGFLRVFQKNANPTATQLWQQFYSGDASLAVKALETRFFEAADKGVISSINSTSWFDLLSKKMNQLKILSDQLVKDLEDHASQKTVELRWRLYSTIALLLSLSLLALMLSKLLSLSITQPIGQLTRAMTYLSTGNRDMRLDEKLANDELRQMAAAYELCRLGLLQGDLENLELQHKDRQSEYYKKLASTDPLTDTYNRRELNKIAKAELDRSGRNNTPLSMLLIDLDHFKKINDTYGHYGGDLVLKDFAQCCKSQLRSSDIIARIGGEEFAILLPETNHCQAFQIAMRIREATNAMEVTLKDQTIHVTASIGIAQWNNEALKDLNELLDLADQALYTAKAKGRDLVWPNPDHNGCTDERCAVRLNG